MHSASPSLLILWSLQTVTIAISPSLTIGTARVFFVVRHKDNLLYTQIKELPLPENSAQDILIDEVIELTGVQTRGKYAKPLRRIAVWNDEHGYVV